MSEIGEFSQIAGGIFTGTAQIATAGANLAIGVGGKAIEVTGALALEIVKSMTKFLGVCGSKAWDTAWKGINAKSAQKVGNMSPAALMKRYGAELEIDRVVTSNLGYKDPETGKGLDPQIWKKTLEKNLKSMGIPFSSGPSYTMKNEEGKKVVVTPLIYPPVFAQRVEEARNVTVREVEKKMKNAGWTKDTISNVIEEDAPDVMSPEEVKETMEKIQVDYADICKKADKEARGMSVKEEKVYNPSPRLLEMIGNQDDYNQKMADKAFQDMLHKKKIEECINNKDIVCHFNAKDIVERKDDYIKVRIKDSDACAFFRESDILSDGNKFVASCNMRDAAFGRIDSNELMSFATKMEMTKYIQENRWTFLENRKANKTPELMKIQANIPKVKPLGKAK